MNDQARISVCFSYKVNLLPRVSILLYVYFKLIPYPKYIYSQRMIIHNHFNNDIPFDVMYQFVEHVLLLTVITFNLFSCFVTNINFFIVYSKKNYCGMWKLHLVNIAYLRNCFIVLFSHFLLCVKSRCSIYLYVSHLNV